MSQTEAELEILRTLEKTAAARARRRRPATAHAAEFWREFLRRIERECADGQSPSEFVDRLFNSIILDLAPWNWEPARAGKEAA